MCMQINMRHLPLGSIAEMEAFLKGAEPIQLSFTHKEECYRFLSEVLQKSRYPIRRRREKILILRYLQKCAGYSKGHVKRLVKRWRKGLLTWNPLRKKRNHFPVRYGPSDIALLIKTDVAHNILSGEATKEILLREYERFKHREYETISKISVSHIYNLRKGNRQYRSSEARHFMGTKSVSVDIGIRRKPRPEGKPGFLRVDTVHQGDQDGEKGVYHINLVDEVAQWEMIYSVEGISERFLKPVFEEALRCFPFVIHEFHADNGSEYINHIVARLLNSLHVVLSKSRSRRSQDNALVEGKNGSIVRKIFGRNFINRKYAPLMNEFNREYVNVYLNFHRPCGFATDIVGAKGKIRKKYETWMTPYERLKSLPNAETFLKPGFTFEDLDREAYAESDNQFAERMRKAKSELFKEIRGW